MKKIIICSAILLTACGQKQPADVAQQAAPPSTTETAPLPPEQAQAPLPNRSDAQTMPPTAAARSGRAYAQQNYPTQTEPQEPIYYEEPMPQRVVSVYVDPPMEEPPPVRVEWAPPPMLVEDIPPPPSDDTVWTGGYWVWQGDWVWAHGRWARPPRHGYHWQNPYYEHRGESVVFVDGYWRAPDRNFVAPSRNAEIALAIVAVGILIGSRPRGPEGVFVPPPPGSHRGLIVPAPLGTAPAVVTGMPPIIREGMHITGNHNTVNNITNITNVTVVAPASATANGQPVNATVPARAYLAAAQAPLVRTPAPAPASSTPIPAFTPGRAPAALPPAQAVQAQVPPSLRQQHPGNRPPPQQGRPPESMSGQPHPVGQTAPDVAHSVAGPAQAIQPTAPRVLTAAPPPGNQAGAARILTAPPAAQHAPAMTAPVPQRPAGNEYRQHAPLAVGTPNAGAGYGQAPLGHRPERSEAKPAPAAQTNNAQPGQYVAPGNAQAPAMHQPERVEARPAAPAQPNNAQPAPHAAPVAAMPMARQARTEAMPQPQAKQVVKQEERPEHHAAPVAPPVQAKQPAPPRPAAREEGQPKPPNDNPQKKAEEAKKKEEGK